MFIDDRLDVLIPMRGIVTQRMLFNPRAEDLKSARGNLDGILRVRDWDDVLRFIYSHHIMKQDLSIRRDVGLLVLREEKSSM